MLRASRREEGDCLGKYYNSSLDNILVKKISFCKKAGEDQAWGSIFPKIYDLTPLPEQTW